MRRNRLQVGNPMEDASVFNAHPYPDIRHLIEGGRQVAQARAAFGHDLKCMLRTIAHRREYPLNKLQRDMFVEQVAHQGSRKTTAREYRQLF